MRAIQRAAIEQQETTEDTGVAMPTRKGASSDLEKLAALLADIEPAFQPDSEDEGAEAEEEEAFDGDALTEGSALLARNVKATKPFSPLSKSQKGLRQPRQSLLAYKSFV